MYTRYSRRERHCPSAVEFEIRSSSQYRVCDSVSAHVCMAFVSALSISAIRDVGHSPLIVASHSPFETRPLGARRREARRHQRQRILLVFDRATAASGEFSITCDITCRPAAATK